MAFDNAKTSLPTHLENPNGIEERLWRRQIKLTMEEIVYPDTIMWMEDDDSISDDQYAKRAFDEIKRRFTK